MPITSFANMSGANTLATVHVSHQGQASSEISAREIACALETVTLSEASPLLDLPRLRLEEIVAHVETSEKSAFQALSLVCKEMRAQVLARISKRTSTTVSAEHLSKKLLLCPNISDITLTGTPSVEQLMCLSGNTKVKNLHLKNACGLGDTHLEILASLPNLEHLKFGSPGSSGACVVRRHGYQLFNDAGVAHLHALKKLKTLDLGESPRISANGLESLLNAMPNLVQIDPRQCIQIAIDLWRSPEQANRLEREFGAKLIGL